jgi:hypothetical protein
MEQNPEHDDANFKRQVQKMHQIKLLFTVAG